MTTKMNNFLDSENLTNYDTNSNLIWFVLKHIKLSDCYLMVEFFDDWTHSANRIKIFFYDKNKFFLLYFSNFLFEKIQKSFIHRILFKTFNYLLYFSLFKMIQSHSLVLLIEENLKLSCCFTNLMLFTIVLVTVIPNQVHIIDKML